MGLFFDIQSRIHTIAQNDTTLNAVSAISVIDGLPSSLAGVNFPALLALPLTDTPQRASGDEFVSDIAFELSLYIADIGTGLPQTNRFNVMEFLDLWREAFLSRPQLQYNDGGLSNVIRNVTFAAPRNAFSMIPYPPRSQGQMYWGAIYTLTIPTHSHIPMKVNGV